MDYEKLRELRNKQNRFGDLAGVRIVEIREGYARTELEVKPEFLNPIGSRRMSFYYGGHYRRLCRSISWRAGYDCGCGYPLSAAGNQCKKTDGRIQGDQEREKSSCISGRSPR